MAMTTKHQIDVDELWERVFPDDRGLVPCVVEDIRTRMTLMVAWVSKEALAKTLETGWATFYSRSRQNLWTKGETSGHRQRLVQLRLDCDGDTLMYVVEAHTPVCHEGPDTCFSRRRSGNAWKREPVVVDRDGSFGVIEALERIIDARASTVGQAEDEGKPSYTRRLIEAGVGKQVAKIREESEELAVALTSETNERVISEGADVLYHLAVALRARKLSFTDINRELSRRFGISGIEEKASRGAKSSEEEVDRVEPHP